MHALEHKIPPPVVALVAVAAMWLISRVTPASGLGVGWRFGLAVAFALSAALIALPAERAFSRARTSISPVDPGAASTLVRGGAFRITRNPMYVGLTALLLAWEAWLASPWALLGPAAFVAFITRFQIIPEERILGAKFGTAYAQYRTRVRRWL